MTDHNVVLYHANCPDGFAAAFAAWLLLGDAATYLPVNYGEPVPELDAAAGAHMIYILDFSYPRDVLEALAAREDVKAVVVLDHHASAQQALAGLPELGSPGKLWVKFDMAQSGAMLAWHYFHPDRIPHDLIRYVQDRDLWTWRLNFSRPVNAALWWDQLRTFDAWNRLLGKWHSGGFTDLMNRGTAILNFQDAMLDRLVLGGVRWDASAFEPVQLMFINSPVLQSEIGERVLQLHPDIECVSVWYERGGWRNVSLRSRKGGFDCSKLAAEFGGGGHQAAAGYRLEVKS